MAPYPCGERGGRAPRECFLAGFFFFGFSRVSCVCPSVRRRLPPPPPPVFFFFPGRTAVVPPLAVLGGRWRPLVPSARRVKPRVTVFRSPGVGWAPDGAGNAGNLTPAAAFAWVLAQRSGVVTSCTSAFKTKKN